MKLHCKVDRNMRHVPERISVLDLWEKLCRCLWIHQIRPLNLNLTQLDYSIYFDEVEAFDRIVSAYNAVTGATLTKLTNWITGN